MSIAPDFNSTSDGSPAPACGVVTVPDFSQVLPSSTDRRTLARDGISYTGNNSSPLERRIPLLRQNTCTPATCGIDHVRPPLSVIRTYVLKEFTPTLAFSS